MIKKKKYIQPQSQLFALCAECEVTKVSKTEGGVDPPKPGGDGDGKDINGNDDMNGAKQNNWFDWDD